jgi:hypothetical protein
MLPMQVPVQAVQQHAVLSGCHTSPAALQEHTLLLGMVSGKVDAAGLAALSSSASTVLYPEVCLQPSGSTRSAGQGWCCFSALMPALVITSLLGVILAGSLGSVMSTKAGPMLQPRDAVRGYAPCSHTTAWHQLASVVVRGPTVWAFPVSSN